MVLNADMFNISDLYARIAASFYFLIDGLGGSILIYGSLPYFFYDLEVSVLDYQKALVLIGLPWSCKVAAGVLSDKYPVLGKHKLWYTRVATLILPFATIGIAMAKIQRDAVGFFVIVSTAIMVINTMFEGQYATKIKFENATNGLASFTKALAMVGSIFGVIVVGAVSNSKDDAGNVRFAYMATTVLVFPLAYYLVAMPKDVFSGDEAAPRSRDGSELLAPGPTSFRHKMKVMPSTQECVLAVAMVATALIIMILMFSLEPGNVYTSLGISLTMSFGLLALTYKTYRETPVLCGICVYSFCYEMMYVDISAAMDVFYTAPEACLFGPNFDLMFYVGWTRILAHVIAVVVICVYTRYMQNWNFREAILVGVTFRICSALTDIIIGKRWNIKAGISDQSSYLLGDAMISPAASTFVQLALVLATTKALIKGKETLTQAVVASLQAMGYSVSK